MVMEGGQYLGYLETNDQAGLVRDPQVYEESVQRSWYEF